MNARRAKGLVISAGTAAFVVAGVYLFHLADETNAGPRPSTGSAEGTMLPAPEGGAVLRDKLLHATAEAAGITPVRGVWGVLMERGFAKGVATVVALADGTASMYLSTGGSVVGGKSYPAAHEAAVKLCEKASGALGATTTVHEFPAPTKGRVRLYILTADGVHTVETDTMLAPADGGARVRARDEDVAPVMDAAETVLNALREATERGIIR